MLKFDFEFYNEQRNRPGGGRRIVSNHEHLFKGQLQKKGFLLKKDIAKLKEEGVAFDELDFIVYSLFRHQNEHRKGHRNFNEISANAYNRICDFSTFYSFTDTVRNTLNQQQNGADRTYSEYQGVAGSLILTNTLFGLTNADYVTIEESSGHAMDYEYNLASTGDNFVKIESKGVSGLNRKVNQEADSILDKKDANNYNAQSRDLYYGVITKVPFSDERANGKIILVDPPTEDVQLDPLKFKLHTRLSYYSNKLNLLIHGRLSEHINFMLRFLELTRESDWLTVFNGMAATEFSNFNSYMTPFYYQCETIEFGASEIGISKARGRVDLLNGGEFIFYGLIDEVFKNLAPPISDQVLSLNFPELEGKTWPVTNVRVKSVIVKRQFQTEELYLKGNLRGYSTGEVFGIFTRQ